MEQLLQTPADKSALGALLHQAILRLCEQHTVYERQLRVMGVLCLGVDSAEVDVVVKLNDTLDKSGAAQTNGKVGAEEPRRKRKRLRPQRAAVHLPGTGLDSPDGGIVSGTDEDGLILYNDGTHHSSEPLTCPVILPGGDDVSVGEAAVRGPGGDPLLCMGAREEGEISPPRVYDTVDGDIGLPALSADEECGALQVDEEAGNDRESPAPREGGNKEDSEVEIMGEYHDFRNMNIALLGSTASGNQFIIPPLSPLVTSFITNVSSSGAIPLPTATTKLHITTAGGGAGGLPSQVQVQIQPAQNAQQRRDQYDTEARVAQVVAAAHAAAQRESEAKAAAAAEKAASGDRSPSKRSRKSGASRPTSADTSLNDEEPLSVLSASNSSSSLSCFAANRVFKCQFCGKAFNRKFCLERHERLHTGVKPYECAYCGERYIRLEDKKRHIRTTHPGKAGGLAVDELSPSGASSPSPADGVDGGSNGPTVPIPIAPAAVSLVGVPLIANSAFK